MDDRERFNKKFAIVLAAIAIVYGVITYFIGFNIIALSVAGFIALLTLLLTTAQSYYSSKSDSHNPSIFWVCYVIPFAVVAFLTAVVYCNNVGFMTEKLLSGTVAFCTLGIIPILGAFLGQMAKIFTFQETTW